MDPADQQEATFENKRMVGLNVIDYKAILAAASCLRGKKQ